MLLLALSVNVSDPMEEAKEAKSSSLGMRGGGGGGDEAALKPKGRRKERGEQPKEKDPSVLTDAQRLENMLGIPPVGYTPSFFREEFCAFCGTEHRNPKMLDIFGYCDQCYFWKEWGK